MLRSLIFGLLSKRVFKQVAYRWASDGLGTAKTDLLCAWLVATPVFWTTILVVILPGRHVALWAIAVAALIALLDLRVIAPMLFPEIAALDFIPQFADRSREPLFQAHSEGVFGFFRVRHVIEAA